MDAYRAALAMEKSEQIGQDPQIAACGDGLVEDSVEADLLA